MKKVILTGTPEEIRAYEALGKQPKASALNKTKSPSRMVVPATSTEDRQALKAVKAFVSTPLRSKIVQWMKDMNAQGFQFRASYTNGELIGRLKVYDASKANAALAYCYLGGTLRVDVRLPASAGDDFPKAHVKPSATTGYWLETSLLDEPSRGLATKLIKAAAEANQ